MIIDHNDPEYRERWRRSGANKYNGAYYYSKEIVANIIPKVETDRNWVTINQPLRAFDHSIVFVHNNLHPNHYEWLRLFDDVILVCGVPSTAEKMTYIHPAIYLPLSIDVAYVERFKVETKDKDAAFFGRRSKSRGFDFSGADVIYGHERKRLLELMARYKRVYAVGRCALEAKVLGCEVMPYDPRFPDPDFWQVIDNGQAAEILQSKLDEIDGR